MSEDEKDVDVESDDVPEVGMEATTTTSNSLDFDDDDSSLDKRAHHNALERRRRDHIKDSFHGLRDCIPSLKGEKVSRAHILNKATEYIRQMQRGGSLRENEINDLKRKNEILEEQVQALEQAKALGSVEAAEEILTAVAERVQSKQRQQIMQQQQQASTPGQGGSRVDKESRRGGDHPPSAAKFPSSPSHNSETNNNKVPSEVSPSQPHPNSINLLASNLKSAQTLLSALQKNLPAGTSLPTNMKNLAARVLASPLRQQGGSATPPHPLPRGIVTATTVPKGSPMASNLAAALQQQQQQLQTHTSSSVSQIKPTSSVSTSTNMSTGTANNLSVAPPTPTTGAQAATQTVSMVTTETTPTVTSTRISPAVLSQATTLSSQLLANSLLQQSTVRGSSVANTSELLAQVSSFLNLPTTAAAAVAAASSKPQAGEGVKGGVVGSRDSVAAAASSSSVGCQAASGCLSNNSAQKGTAPVVTETQGESPNPANDQGSPQTSPGKTKSEGVKRGPLDTEEEVSLKKPRLDH